MEKGYGRPESDVLCLLHSVSLSRNQPIVCIYLVCQFTEVLLRVADHVSHSENGAVGVVDHVKVACFDVITSDGRKEVPSAHMTDRSSGQHIKDQYEL